VWDVGACSFTRQTYERLYGITLKPKIYLAEPKKQPPLMVAHATPYPTV
jgi:hypothetical protein